MTIAASVGGTRRSTLVGDIAAAVEAWFEERPELADRYAHLLVRREVGGGAPGSPAPGEREDSTDGLTPDSPEPLEVVITWVGELAAEVLSRHPHLVEQLGPDDLERVVVEVIDGVLEEIVETSPAA